MIRLFHTGVDEAETAIVNQVLSSGQLVMGQHIVALEEELTNYLDAGVGGTVACASGTDALTLALEETGCTGLGVIVPAMTFSATHEAVIKAGAVPVVCDIDDETLVPTVTQIRSAMVTSITQGIPIAGVIIVHLYGWPAYDLEAVVDFCRGQNICLIEDCAQSFGASLNGRETGTFGNAAAFSFYPTKPLGGIGDGGAVYFPNAALAAHARAKRNHGRTDGGQLFPGYNSRMDEINAAVLRHRLMAHEENIDKRRELSGRYHHHGIKKLSFNRKGRGVPYVYPVLVDEREATRFRLADIGVETRVHYDPPVSGLPYVNADCPNAKWVSRRILSLPCHQGMTLEDVDRISDAVRGG